MVNSDTDGSQHDDSSPRLMDLSPDAVPPPPEFGTVLEAPPPRNTGPQPTVEAASNTRVWLFGVGAFALVAGTIGFFLGGLGDDDEPPAETAAAANDKADEHTAVGGAAASEAAEAKPAEPPAQAEPPPPPPPCPEGMVEIDGGKFFMGTDREVPVLGPARPAHQVEVAAFCIDQHEVTVDEYRSCSTKGECKRAFRKSDWPGATDTEVWHPLCNESYDDRGTHPINCVSWEQARAFCEWRSARLPSESEWELAARGTDGRVYSWGDDPPDATRMNGCGTECSTWRAEQELSELPAVLYDADDTFVGTSPVGSFPKGRTQAGLDDMAGNLFEWTGDAYAPYPGSDAAPHDDDIPRRVIRGGAFNSFLADHADPALRFPQAESAHTHGIGFRCATEARPGPA